MAKSEVSIQAAFDLVWKQMKREFEFESKLYQVPFPMIHYHYKVKSWRLHINGYSEN
jgi:hypothetical protein